MPKKTTSLLEKITQSENKIKELIQARQRELVEIITKYNAIAIDDHLLAGFLLFALNPANKDHPIFKEFKELAKSPKSPSKPKKPNLKTAKKTN